MREQRPVLGGEEVAQNWTLKENYVSSKWRGGNSFPGSVDRKGWEEDWLLLFSY